MISIFLSEQARKLYRIPASSICPANISSNSSYRIDIFARLSSNLVLLVNEATLFTRIFSSSIAISDLVSAIDDRHCKEDSSFLFHKGGNRHVIGSVNDMKWMIEVAIEREPSISLIELSSMINRIPFTYLGYDSPDRRQSALSKSS